MLIIELTFTARQNTRINIRMFPSASLPISSLADLAKSDMNFGTRDGSVYVENFKVSFNFSLPLKNKSQASSKCI